MKNKIYIIWIAFLTLIVLIGAYHFYVQTTEGHFHSGVSDEVPWGIFISAFAFFVGASAGATIIGLMVQAFGRDDYEPLAIRAVLVGILSLMAAVLFVIVDVGNPITMVGIPWIFMNTTSPFFYTSITYYLFGAILLAQLLYAVKIAIGSKKKRDKIMAKWLAIIAVPFALVVVLSIDGFLFGFIKAREFWNTPLLPPHFAIAALVTGIAIMILVAVVTSKMKNREIVKKETLNHMGTLLAFFIAIIICLDVFDILTLVYSETAEGVEAWDLLTGEHLPLFLLNAIGLIGAFTILLFKQGRTVKGLGIASVIVITAVAAYRYNLVIVGLKVPLFPGQEVQYFPSISELSIGASLIALIFLLYAVITRVLPIEAREVNPSLLQK